VFSFPLFFRTAPSLRVGHLAKIEKEIEITKILLFSEILLFTEYQKLPALITLLEHH